jgi:Tol biopolymer transport system component
MTRRYGVAPAEVLLSSLLFAACGGDSTAPAPATGTLEFNDVTTGNDIDPDGFVLALDGASFQVIPANGTLSITTAAGSHTLAISGVSFNCDIAAPPTTASVTAGSSALVDVRATCTPFLRNALVFTSDQFGASEVMVMRSDGSRRERLTSDQGNYDAPAVSPDGQSIAVPAFTSAGSTGIYLFDRFGKGREKLVGRSNFDGSPAWSPDGTRIAFRSAFPGPSGDHDRIYIVNRDGTGLRQLTPETTDYTTDDGPSWSPDGAQIVFSRFNQLYMINADGTGLMATSAFGHHPAWSPDGAHIAFEGFQSSGTAEIYVMDRAFNATSITPGGNDYVPRWSPDGHQLVFERAAFGGFQLYKINADGSSLTRLSTPAQNDRRASWGPNF